MKHWKLLASLLFRHTGRWQMGFNLLGSLLGFLLVLISLQFFLDFKSLLSENTDLVKSQYLVVNKKVGMLNTLSLGSSVFQKNEIEELKKQQCIESVGEFVLNHFNATANMNIAIAGAQSMFMELFFEAVDNQYLDINPEGWNWHIGDKEIPLILPNDFMNMYNFNYAPSHGFPQLSQATLKWVTFDISIRGNTGKQANFIGKIVGFSNRISTILVPKNFLDFANHEFAGGMKTKPHRLILKARNEKMAELTNYIDRNGYEANTELMRNGKFSGFVYNALNILASAGLLVILVSLTGFIQFSQLLVSKSKYELETLSMLGFSTSAPIRLYTIFYLLAYCIIFIVSLLGVYLIKDYLSTWLFDKGITLQAGVSCVVALSGLGLMLVLLVINFIALRNDVQRIMA